MTTAAPLIWPTTPLQQGLVALTELQRSERPTTDGAAPTVAGGAGPAHYLGQSVVALTGPVELDALRAAIAAVLVEQPHLHAGFLMSDDVAPVQFVDADLPPVIEVHRPEPVVGDAPVEPGVETTVEAMVEAMLAWQHTLEWDLAEPPLLRWDVVLDADGQAVALVIAAHHAVLDGWSMPLLVAQIARHYAGLVGAPSDAPAARGSYGDHLAWLASQDADAARAFWAEHLAGLEPSRPAWLRNGDGVRRPISVEIEIDPPEAGRTGTGGAGTTSTSGLAGRGLTPAALARTCWGLALDAVGGTQGTPFAVAVSTRDGSVADADALIGLSTDAVLVAHPADPRATVLEEAARDQRRWAATLPHQHVGLRGIHAALRTGESATSLFAVESAPAPGEIPAGPVTFALSSVTDDTHYPLAATLSLGPHGSDGPWRLEVTYDASRVEAATARRHTDAFAAFVAAAGAELAADSDGTRDIGGIDNVAGIDVLGTADRALLAGAQRRRGVRPSGYPASPGPVTTRAHGAPQLLPHAFAATCARVPACVALVDAGPSGRGTQWTFRQLAAQVRGLCEEVLALLPATGATDARTPVVAVSRPRSAHTVVALLAIHDAGAAALVLDPALPGARREQVLADVGADLVITADGIDVRHGLPRGATARATTPDDLACVVLTSGSTGLPKPVAVPHRALAHLLEHHRHELHPGGEQAPRQVAHAAAFHFDAHWDALLALYAGHTVHVLADDLYLDPYALADYTEAERIDYLDLTPTVWSALLSADAFTRLPRVCVLGGEALPAALWTRLRELTAGTDTVVLNLYGPTEATVDAAWASLVEHPTPVVGRPVGATGVLVLDDLLRRVPPGTPGELYLTGPQLADGYLRRPGASAERFVANPYPRRDTAGAILRGDERMYRTGDVARWTSEGLLVLGGRTDGQLSLAGRRVEPGEIEAVLTGDERVREAVVVARSSVSGRGRLVGYVVPHRGSATAPAELVDDLRTACRSALPAALVPADLVVLDAWPLTPNGKLDRSVLPDPGVVGGRDGRKTPDAASSARSGTATTSARAAAGDTSAAGTDAQASGAGAVADARACLADVLRVPVEQVSADADFFALGGDSIAAIQVCGRLRGRGWTVRAADVLAGRTIAAIAAAAVPVVSDAPSPAANYTTVDAEQHAVGTSGRKGAEDAADDPFGLLTPQRRADLAAHLEQAMPGARLERVLPLSPTQLGIYVDAHRLHPDPYRTTVTLRLDLPAGESCETTGDDSDDQFDIATALDTGVAGWFARHESLRIAVWHGDLPQPVAVVVDHLDVPHRHLDARHLDDDAVAALLMRVRRDELDRDLSFEAGRLAGYTWVRTSATTSYLVVSMHHLLADGWSTPVLARELGEHLAGRSSARRDTVFADYLHWWEQQDREAADDVWRREFTDATPTLLGSAPGDPGATSSRERRIARVDLTDDDATTLATSLRAQGLTTAAACQAAWARVLADLTGAEDVTYLLASSGRPEHLDGIEEGVGMFVTTRPVRVGGPVADDRIEVDADRAQGHQDGHHIDRAPLTDLARAVTTALARTETAAHLGLGRITQLVGAVADTLVVVENYPRSAGSDVNPSGPALPSVTMIEGSDATTFAVTATVTLGDRPSLEIEIDPAQCDLDPLALARAWGAALGAFASVVPGADGDSNLARLTETSDESPTPATALRPRLSPLAVTDHDADPSDADVAPDGGSGKDSEDGARPDAARRREIADVMAQVLGVDSLEGDESFFDAGGDSILAVRLVGALRGRGLRVGIADVFAAGSPRALARRAVADTSRAAAEGDPGRLRLTPALAWYRDVLRRGGSGRGFQQLREVVLPADTPVTTVGAAVERLLTRHDALRLRIRLDVADFVPVAPPAATRLTVVAADALLPELRRLGAEIDPGAGDLVRWALVPGEDALRVVVLAHHVAVDAVSWGILTDELQALVAGTQLPPAPSFAAWSRTQATDRVLAGAAASAARWTRALAPAAPLITASRRPADPTADLGLVGAAREIEVRLDPEVTAGLLDAVRRGWRMETLLLAALTAQRRGADADLVVELEGHGRPTDVAADDPRADDPGAGAVGWFTATWPLRLPARRGLPLHRHVACTAQAVGASRLDGPDYGLLRHVHPGHREALAEAERRCPPQVLVNYLGTSATSAEPAGNDPAALEGALGLHDDLPVSHPVEINAHLGAVADDTHGSRMSLVARWQVAAPFADHADHLVEEWTRALRSLADLDLDAPAAVVHDAVGLSARQLDELLERPGDEAVEAVWPPTPVQRGMIFHAALESDAGSDEAGDDATTDPYTSVLDVALAGDLDQAALREAIESVLAEHPQLRLRVRWVSNADTDDDTTSGPTVGAGDDAMADAATQTPARGGDARPVLVTVASTDIGWRVVDLTDASTNPPAGEGSSPSDRVASVVAAELRRGYDLEHDPLLRVTLVRTTCEPRTVDEPNTPGELAGTDMPGAAGQAPRGEHRLVVANHHLLLDGWSMPLLLDAVLDRYADLVRPQGGGTPRASTPVPPAALARSPFARHVERATLAAEVGAGDAIERRRALLADSTAGPVTAALPGDPIDQGSHVGTHPGVAIAARRHGTTDSAVLAAAWGATLAALSGTDEAVTGTVVSGRDPEADADLLGMFTDTVPLLARFGAGRTVADTVGDLAGQIAAALTEPAVGLAPLGSALGRGHLFDALLVVENYPGGDTDARAAAAGLQITALDGGDATHYPLSLTVETDSQGSELRVEHDRATVPAMTAAAMVDALGRVLSRLVDSAPEAPAATLVQEAARALADAPPLLDRSPALGLDASSAAAGPHAAGQARRSEDSGVPTPPTKVGGESESPGGSVAQLVAIYRDLFAGSLGQPATGRPVPADAGVGIEGIDADANFFALGGDSILAMSLVTACRARGLRIRAGDVFTAPTPRELAGRATTMPAASTSTSTELITLDDRGAAALDDLLRSL